jgi:hypothetical protein
MASEEEGEVEAEDNREKECEEGNDECEEGEEQCEEGEEQCEEHVRRSVRSM